MSFNTALSGLRAANSDLSVTSNNIANVTTTGFKNSRAEFADIFATSSLGASNNAIGSGVLLSRVAQQFTQGNLEFTQNTLDLAISGSGFFVLTDDPTSASLSYTRSGAFGLDANGNVVNAQGKALRAFPVNSNGTVTASSLSNSIPLLVPSTAGAPQSTTNVDLGINLPANALPLDPLAFDPTNELSFSASTSVTIFDSLGEPHIATTYYVKLDTTLPQPAPFDPLAVTNGVNFEENSWGQYLYLDNAPVDITTGATGAGAQTYGVLTFDNVGSFQREWPTPMVTAALGFTNGADATQTLTLDYQNNNPTQFASAFNASTLSQDGFPIGRLGGIEISETGIVRANFSNGQQRALGKIAMARFSNDQGLAQIGNTTWTETLASGAVLAGEAGTSTFGNIRGGALETSNVDLTGELVNLITAQRNFQANAKAIETNNALTTTIIQIR